MPDVLLLHTDFQGFEPGPFSAAVGAHTEYHYLPAAAPRHGWAVACFGTGQLAQRAWEVKPYDGRLAMCQTIVNDKPQTHPFLTAGDPLWEDYQLTVRFTPAAGDRASGLVIRYHNNRCYYFCGFDGPRLVLKRVRHETAFHRPDEQVLASLDVAWQPDREYRATVEVAGSRLLATVEGVGTIEAADDTWPAGKIGLLADRPTVYHEVRVTCNAEAKAALDRRRAARAAELAGLQAANPKPVLWKRIETKGFGAGRNLRFGDLTGDGQMDVLIGQIQHHGPSDQYSELSCLTAMTFDGEILWQIGQPDPEKHHLTNDVGFQIHDVDHDGRNEVVYCQDFQIHVIDGATGELKYQAPTPLALPPADRYERILGDCLYFCDLRGRGWPQDIIIKDRYWHFWALTDRLEPLWSAPCKTGHYPWAADIDGDGHDELAIGYALFDHDGTRVWDLEQQIQDHADGIAIVDLPQLGAEPLIYYAASDAGALLVNLRGEIVKRHWIGHVQNPAIANFRPDLPGLEIVSINFWGNQGILHFYDSNGDIYHDCEPLNMGSMCLPINWRGDGQEFFVHNPNVEHGGMYDGWGRKVVTFPDDGHPDQCNAVLDICGDCRDEVVVWDPESIWVYTQDDGPRTGRLYQPVRNPLYNYSNYQATVSLPGWTEG